MVTAHLVHTQRLRVGKVVRWGGGEKRREDRREGEERKERNSERDRERGKRERVTEDK